MNKSIYAMNGYSIYRWMDELSMEILTSNRIKLSADCTIIYRSIEATPEVFHAKRCS